MRLIPFLCIALVACSADPVLLPDAGGADTGAPVDAGAPDTITAIDVQPDTVDVPDVTDAPTAADALPDGCVSTTPGNCCGVACPAPANGAAACVGGACGVGSCLPGFGDCNGNPADGCEVEFATSAAHCGACRAACVAGLTCVSSSCVACPDLRLACGGACVDPQTDPAHCGACNAPCAVRPNARATCTNGGCGFTCNAGFADCDGNAANGCESTNTDATNCGTCGNRCAPGVMCIDQRCGCAPGRADCDGNPATVCETNTAMGDTANCGGCGMRCPAAPAGAMALCVGGTCRIGNVMCPPGFGNCDGADANGCEVTTLSNVDNCGAGGPGAMVGCGNVCPRSGGTATCTNGVCNLVCNAGRADCDGNRGNGCELNTSADRANCGGCNVRCTALQTCRDGACVLL